MSRYPKRDEHTHWNNEEPITDVHEALEILSEQSPTDSDEFRLHPTRGKLYAWEIVVPWYTEGDSGGDQSGYHYYQIDETLAETLVKEGLVEKRREPRMGYTHTHNDQLVISQAGRDALDAYLTQMRAKAESLLRPGVHTDLTGKPDYAGHDRDGYHCGKLYFEFRLPDTDRRCRVYPEEDRVVEPEGLQDA